MNILGATVKTIGNVYQKVNLAKLIDNLERDQVLADHLEHVNQELLEEEERKRICREAELLCLQTIESHLEEFLETDPDGTYEGWISSLHPDNTNENVNPNHPTFGGGPIDHRFYVKESDHRILWNRTMKALADGADVQNMTIMNSGL